MSITVLSGMTEILFDDLSGDLRDTSSPFAVTMAYLCERLIYRISRMIKVVGF
jgi:hypothetical protein